MTVTWQLEEAAAVVGFRSARACWTGQWPQPLSHGMESPCRLSYVSHSSQSFPNLPFLVFSNFPILLVIFFCLLGPDKAPCCPNNPSPPFFLLHPSTSTFPMDRPQLLCHLIQPGDKDHSLRRSTPPATSEAEARGASTFQGPPTQDHHPPPSAVYEHLMNT